MRRLPIALAALSACLAAIAPAAHAGEISVSGTTITYVAYPGEENFLNVNWGNTSAGDDFVPYLDDHEDIDAVAPCEFSFSLGASCPTAGTNPTFIVRLGDMNDIAESTNDRAAGTHIELYGEAGDDRLQSDAGADLLDGGEGNDEMSPDEDEAGPGDVVVGGPGKDTLQTGNPISANGPIGVSFDGVANDGYVGEGDNYATDLEDLSATAAAVPINFVGNDGPNQVQLRSESADTVQGLGGDDLIDGANGNDTLDGGAGNDTIYGGGNDDTVIGGPGVDSLAGEGSASGLFISVAGSDRIDARDGVQEQLNCGLGADIAIVDPLDVVPQDPGSLCEVVDRGAATGPSGPAPAIRSGALRARNGRIAVSLACPAGGSECRGKLRIRTASAVRLGGKRRKVDVATGSFAVAAGARATVRLRPTKAGRSLLRKVSRVRVQVSAGAGKRRTVTLRG